jgi:hypothetical protein
MISASVGSVPKILATPTGRVGLQQILMNALEGAPCIASAARQIALN